jgi:hypothetical protein
MDLRDYNRRQVDQRLGRLETDVGTLHADVAVLKTDVAVLKTDVAVIKARMVTKDDLIQLERWMFALILPIYAVLVVILIFLYNAKL